MRFVIASLVLAGCGSENSAPNDAAPVCEEDSFTSSSFSVDEADVQANSHDVSPKQLERAIELTLSIWGKSAVTAPLHVVLLDRAGLDLVCPPRSEGCQIEDTIYYRYSGPCVGRSAFVHEFGHWYKRATTGDSDGAHTDDAFFGLKDYDNSVVGKVHAQLYSEFPCACDLDKYVY